MRQRYFTSKRDGKNLVVDRELELVIARCFYREQAVLVCAALNAWERDEKLQGSLVPAHEIDEPIRKAIAEIRGET